MNNVMKDPKERKRLCDILPMRPTFEMLPQSMRHRCQVLTASMHCCGFTLRHTECEPDPIQIW